MQKSSKNQYPDSFESLSPKSSSGHIEHRNVDMDTHDRAVRRSAGHHSRKQSSSTPLWLICILIFVGLIGFFIIRFSGITGRQSDNASVEVIVTEEPTAEIPDTTEAALSDSGSPPEETAALPADGNTLIVDAPAENTSGITADIQSDTSLVPDADMTSSVPGSNSVNPEPPPTDEHVHSYVRGVCSVCGAKPKFLKDWLPDEFYREAEHRGTVTSVEYTTKAYATYNIPTYHKEMNVYLPYGYDETRQYNVLILLPGQGDSEDDWLVNTHTSAGKKMCGRIILDNLIEQKLCEPCIVVTPVAETKYVQGLTAGIVQMQDELRETILPYIVKHYSTYAKDGSAESLRAAREHFGLGGLSNGALITFEGGMRQNFDLFANYCAFSGNGEPWKTVSTIQLKKYAKYPVNCFFTGAGTQNDWQQHYTKVGFEYFVEKDDRFVKGENSWRVDVNGGHEWKVWYTCLYNAMQVMFQSME